jgi:two-component sensor histidine kinase
MAKIAKRAYIYIYIYREREREREREILLIRPEHYRVSNALSMITSLL